MTICTFGDLFQTELEKLIELGGQAGQVVTLANAYQGRDPIARSQAFRDWLDGELFLCERCEHEFKAGRRDIREEDKVLCSSCQVGRE